jgi:phospholipase C
MAAGPVFTALTVGAETNGESDATLKRINHLVVIYEESRSFDNQHA